MDELHAVHAADGSAGEKVEKYKQWVEARVAGKDVEALGMFVEFAVGEGVNVQVSRPALSAWADMVLDIPESRGVEGEDPALDHADMIRLGAAALDAIQPRTGSFQEQAMLISECMSWVHQDKGDWHHAIAALKAIPLDTVTVAEKGDIYKVQMWVRIARLYLELEDYHSAEVWINKAWPLMTPQMDQTTQLQFNTSFARIHDGKQRFFDAARKYYEVSHLVSGDEQGDALKQAIICVMLTDAGPQRSRLLTALYRDERTHRLGSLYDILQKMFFDRILRPSDIDEVKELLQEHHQALTADGRTVLDRAVMQHNLRSASRFYYNISFGELGALLSITPEAAERVAANMISEGRLEATIDQVKDLLIFTSDGTVFNQWDQQISAACNAVNALSETIVAMHPQYKTAAAAVPQ